MCCRCPRQRQRKSRPVELSAAITGPAQKKARLRRRSRGKRQKKTGKAADGDGWLGEGGDGSVLCRDPVVHVGCLQHCIDVLVGLVEAQPMSS